MPRYTTFSAPKYVTQGCATLSEMADALEAEARRLRDMEAAGVSFDNAPMEDTMAIFSTDDPAVAKRFGMELEQNDDDFDPEDN